MNSVRVVVSAVALVSSVYGQLSSVCTTEPSVYSHGMDLGWIDLTGQDTLEFYTVGDWGVIDCTKDDCDADRATSIGDPFGVYAADSNNNGEFVLNVGDNFYQKGITYETMGRWNTTFEDLFHGDALLDKYFYTVLGNHDWDPNEDGNGTDDGVANQVDYTYTSDSALNPNMRWCLPSYYYQFGYRTDEFNVRFIGVDGISLLPTDEGGCVAEDGGDTGEMCLSDSVPTREAQLEWLESVLNQSYVNNEYTVVFSHYPIISAGKYGVLTNGWRIFNGVNTTLNEKCGTKGYFGGFEIFSKDIANLLVQYNVQLYISGHEHNSELFVGDYKDNSGKQMISMLTGSWGKTDGILCATQEDIDEQYNQDDDRDITWEYLYNEAHTGFGHVIMTKDGISVKVIDENLDVVSEASVAHRDLAVSPTDDDSKGITTKVQNMLFGLVMFVVMMMSYY